MISSVSKRILSALLVLSTVLLFSVFALPAKAADDSAPVTVYSESGEILKTFDSMEECYDYYLANSIVPYGEVCDIYGHVHGSSTETTLIVNSVNGYSYYMVTCRWCGSVISITQVT